MAEQVAEAAAGSHVVKALNLCHVDVWRMTPPEFGGRALTVPICGDDPGALAAVRSLITDLGCAIGLLFQGADPRSMFPPIEYAAGPPSR
jgi:predicted dinucleotide-binding enzyme